MKFEIDLKKISHGRRMNRTKFDFCSRVLVHSSLTVTRVNRISINFKEHSGGDSDTKAGPAFFIFVYQITLGLDNMLHGCI